MTHNGTVAIRQPQAGLRITKYSLCNAEHPTHDKKYRQKMPESHYRGCQLPQRQWPVITMPFPFTPSPVNPLPTSPYTAEWRPPHTTKWHFSFKWGFREYEPRPPTLFSGLQNDFWAFQRTHLWCRKSHTFRHLDVQEKMHLERWKGWTSVIYSMWVNWHACTV